MLSKDELDGLKARVYSMQQFISIAAQTYIEDMTKLLRHIDLMRLAITTENSNLIHIPVPYGAGEIDFPVRLYVDEDGMWVAVCTMLKGCSTQGETMREAIENIKDAIAGFMDALKT